MPLAPKLRYSLTKPGLGAILDAENPLAIVSPTGLACALILNEGGGGTIRDLVPPSSTGGVGIGTLGGGVVWRPSPFGAALDFNNTTSALVTFTNNPAFNPAGTWLMGFNLRFVTASSFPVLFAGQGTGNIAHGIYYDTNFSQLITFQNGFNYMPVSTPSLATWHIMSANPTTGADQYIADGALIANNGTTSAGAGVPFQLGSSVSASTVDLQIAFLYIWNRSLSDSERQSIARAPFSLFTTPSALRRYWQFGISATTPALPPRGLRINQAVNRSNTY